MRITQCETFVCDLGWRTVSYLKISTDSGATGWSEFVESFGNAGLTAVVNRAAEHLVGRRVDEFGLLCRELVAMTRPASGGLNRQAVGAIENALYDLRARSLGVPVSTLLGGRLRDRVPVYWSHCGVYRSGAQARFLPDDPITSYAELAEFARTLPGSGFRTVKTNMLAFDDPELRSRTRPWVREPDAAGFHFDRQNLTALEKTLAAFREGMGDEVDLLVDVNFVFDASGARRVADIAEAYGVGWLELDGLDPTSLATVARSTTVPLASGESLFGREQYQPYFDARAFDTAIVDVVWNGIAESARICSAAETVGLSVAPHNFYGHLSTYMSAQLLASVPTMSMLEVDVDQVPWRDDFVSTPPTYAGGFLAVPDGPGWGVEVNEQAVRAHATQQTSIC